jgi:hypothetical protein
MLLFDFLILFVYFGNRVYGEKKNTNVLFWSIEGCSCYIARSIFIYHQLLYQHPDKKSSTKTLYYVQCGFVKFVFYTKLLEM